jgi:hypothetical protein
MLELSVCVCVCARVRGVGGVFFFFFQTLFISDCFRIVCHKFIFSFHMKCMGLVSKCMLIFTLLGRTFPIVLNVKRACCYITVECLLWVSNTPKAEIISYVMLLMCCCTSAVRSQLTLLFQQVIIYYI